MDHTDARALSRLLPEEIVLHVKSFLRDLRDKKYAWKPFFIGPGGRASEDETLPARLKAIDDALNAPPCMPGTTAM
jgi:hypothetical protein